MKPRQNSQHSENIDANEFRSRLTYVTNSRKSEMQLQMHAVWWNHGTNSQQ